MADTVVDVVTSMGTFSIELDSEKAPKSVANFLEYVDAKHYDGTLFHRVINGFMVQGGGYDEKYERRATKAPVENEADNGLKNEKYTVAMARTPDPNSASSQFFINVKDNEFLNYKAPTMQGWGYAVFGKVVEGKDTVDKIAKVATGDARGMQNVPTTPVVIEKAECL